MLGFVNVIRILHWLCHILIPKIDLSTGRSLLGALNYLPLTS